MVWTLPGTNVIKLILLVIMSIHNDLECVSLAALSSLFICVWIRPRTYPIVDHLKPWFGHRQGLMI